MCKGISGFCHKQRGVLVTPKSNSHTKIAEILGIKDNKRVEFRQFVKFELHPLGSLTSTKKKDWKFVLDEDERPDWFFEDDWSDRCKKICFEFIIAEWVKGGCECSLDLRGTSVSDLGQLQSVGGYLDLEGTPVSKEMASKVKVGRNIYF